MTHRVLQWSWKFESKKIPFQKSEILTNLSFLWSMQQCVCISQRSFSPKSLNRCIYTQCSIKFSIRNFLLYHLIGTFVRVAELNIENILSIICRKEYGIGCTVIRTQDTEHEYVARRLWIDRRCYVIDSSMLYCTTSHSSWSWVPCLEISLCVCVILSSLIVCFYLQIAKPLIHISELNTAAFFFYYQAYKRSVGRDILSRFQ